MPIALNTTNSPTGTTWITWDCPLWGETIVGEVGREARGKGPLWKATYFHVRDGHTGYGYRLQRDAMRALTRLLTGETGRLGL